MPTKASMLLIATIKTIKYPSTKIPRIVFKAQQQRFIKEEQ